MAAEWNINEIPLKDSFWLRKEKVVKKISSPINSGVINDLERKKKISFKRRHKNTVQTKVVLGLMGGSISPGWAPAQTGCSRRSLERGTTTSGRQSAETKSKCFCVFCQQQVTNTHQVFSSNLPRKDPAEADDDQDVEDGRADDGAHSDVSFGDEHSCVGKETVVTSRDRYFYSRTKTVYDWDSAE